MVYLPAIVMSGEQAQAPSGATMALQWELSLLLITRRKCLRSFPQLAGYGF